jgi:hypothetical protein
MSDPTIALIVAGVGLLGVLIKARSNAKLRAAIDRLRGAMKRKDGCGE